MITTTGILHLKIQLELLKNLNFGAWAHIRQFYLEGEVNQGDLDGTTSTWANRVYNYSDENSLNMWKAKIENIKTTYFGTMLVF